jgi:hypothetical protein
MPELAEKSYLALKAETVEGTAVIPTVHLPLESEDLSTQLNLTADRRMYGNDWETNDLSPGERSHQGSLKLWADPDTLGYLLDMCLVKGSTTGSGADGYTHPFTPGDPQSYTIEIPRDRFAYRYFGVKGSELNLAFEDGKLKATLNVMGTGHFSVAATKDALTGASSSTIVLTQDYDLEPTRGLVAGDVLIINPDDALEEEATISVVESDGVTITLTGAVTNSHDAGVNVALKAQTASFGTLQKPFFFGDLLVGYAATAALAETAAATKATATPSQEVEFVYNNNMMNAPFSQQRDNSQLLPRIKQATLTIKRLFDNPEQRSAWLRIAKQAVSLITRGELIKTTAPTTRNQIKITLHKAKLEDNKEPLNVGEYIYDEQVFKAAYDSSDAKALTVELINETATY